ncbi:MAG: hypothetical protein ABEK50_13065 [bacterium]
MIPVTIRRVLMVMVVMTLMTLAGMEVSAASDTAVSDLAPPGTPLVLKQAGSIHIERANDRMVVRGDVIAVYGDYTIRSDTLVYNRSAQRAQMGGNVKVTTPEAGSFVGSYFEMYLPTNEISGGPSRGLKKPWYFKGKRIEGDADTEIQLPSGEFTSCNLETPHYNFSSSQLYIYPSESIIGYNTTMNIGGMPVFYLPYIYIDLQNLLGRWEIKPGYESRQGVTLEVNYRYLMPSDPGPYTATILTDMRQKAGAGAGFDVGYKKDDQTANLYFFGAERSPTRLNEEGELIRADTEQQLWRTEVDVDYQLGDSWSVQGNADWSQNNRFNDDLQGSLGGRGRPRRSVEAILSRPGENSIFRIDAIREEKAVQRDSEVIFQQEQSVLPRMQFQLYPVRVNPLGRAIYYSMTSEAEHSDSPRSDEELWRFSLEQFLTKSISLTPSLGQSYRVGYKHAYNETVIDNDTSFRSVGAASFDVINSYQVSDQSTISVDYSMTKQLNRQDEVEVNLQGEDLGIEQDGYRTKELGMGFQWRNKHTAGSFRTGYDLRNSVMRSIDPDDRVLSPQFSLQSQLTPRVGFNQYLRYSWQDRLFQQINTGFDADVTRNFSFSLTGNYNVGQEDDILKLENNFEWTSPGGNWALQGDVTYDRPSAEVEDSRFTLYRRMHQWEMRLSFHQIEERSRSVWFTFNLVEFPNRAVGFIGDVDDEEYEFEQGRPENIAD